MHKKLWEILKKRIKFKKKHCDFHCPYLLKLRNSLEFGCKLFGKKLKEINPITYKRCKECINIFDKED